jgi:hypothetical protein
LSWPEEGAGTRLLGVGEMDQMQAGSNVGGSWRPEEDDEDDNETAVQWFGAQQGKGDHRSGGGGEGFRGQA